MKRAKTLKTVGATSKARNISQPTLRLYCDSGLIPCVYDNRGNRLLTEEAGKLAVAVKAERMKKVGRGERARRRA